VSLDVVFLFQSDMEHQDQDFYFVSAPFLEDTSNGKTFDSIYLYGNSFCFVDETDKEECPVKGHLRVRKYSAETSSFIGEFIYGQEPAQYQTAIDIKVQDLEVNTIYGVWYFLKSSVGPDTDSYIYYALVKTEKSGGRDPVIPDLP
jgi:hypothetical protein